MSKNQDASITATPSFLLYLQLTSVSVIWGGTFVAGRFLSGGVPPLLAASIRFLIASLVLIIFLVVTRTPFIKPNSKQLLQLAFLGFFGIFLYNICFFYGLHYVNASRASLIVALNPAVIALASYMLFQEKLSAPKVLGILFCLFGAGLVIVSKNTDVFKSSNFAWLGDLLILGCVMSWVIFSVFSKTLSNAIGPLHTVTYAILLGTIMLCSATFASGEVNTSSLSAISLPQLLSLLYLGVLGSALAYILYYNGIQKIGATRSGVFIALNPMTAVLLGALILGERLTFSMYVGGVFAVLGIYLCNRNKPLKFSKAPSFQSESA
ncbi:MAG: Permease of the drug/metabolite transporter superfamily [Herbaspirillum sp.]|nr:Permease of the drug/metabolite transporter superfamily [Herbaspirillum sp.]